MAESSSVEEKIRQEFEKAHKEYAAYDKTLDAVSALSFVLENVKPIAEETTFHDFRPRLDPPTPNQAQYTPDGLIIQKSCDFVLELKTSWNEEDIRQTVQYGRSKKYYRPDGSTHAFGKNRCMLLGYQNSPGDSNLVKLFDAWDLQDFGFPLVLFRYSLEQAAGGDQMFFVRVPYQRNGLCPSSSLGKAMNFVQGFPVSINSLKLHRTKFHKAGDQVIASYAAVLWWTTYARHYLTEEQKIEMAGGGGVEHPLSHTPGSCGPCSPSARGRRSTWAERRAPCLGVSTPG